MSSTTAGQVDDDTSKDFDINRFEELLSRLEASKGRQQRQKSVEGRRDIFSQGLASMMSNFWCKRLSNLIWIQALMPSLSRTCWINGVHQKIESNGLPKSHLPRLP